MRAEDTVICARLLAGYRTDAGPRNVHLTAIGEAGPPALHAAALEPQLFRSVHLERSLVSWASVITTPAAKNQLVNSVHGALRFYDLPDLLGALPGGFVTVVDAINAAGQTTGATK
jgi:hypothetical protein